MDEKIWEWINERYTRRWVCNVVRSGYHNGAGCLPSDPHEDWGCQYLWEHTITDERYNLLRERFDH